MVERITYADEWFDNVVSQGRLILEQLEKETFHRYREVGKLILDSGYQKGQWKSKHKSRAIQEWHISQPVFSRMVQLGEMSEQEFILTENNFPSVRAWANQPREDKPNILTIALPDKKYRTIIVDPPWNTEKILREVRPNQESFDYETMTVDEIKALPIPKLAFEEGCHIYLWTTHKYLPYAFDVFKAWNVNYECLLTWVKNVGFTPFSWMYSTEHALFGRIGNLELLKKGERLDFSGKVREHSRKPDEFYELVKKVSPEPRIDFFGRETREGFEPYGNETTKFNLP